VAERLRVDTWILHRDLWSGAATAAPVAAGERLAYGDRDRVLDEVRVGLAELLAGAPPHQISRHLLPAGLALRTVEVAITLPGQPPRLAGPHPLAVTVVVVPERGASPTDGPRGHWVFAPTLGHTFFVRKGEDLDARVRTEVARIVVARAPDGLGWRRLLPAESDELVATDVHVAGVDPGKGTRLLEAERRRRAEETLASIGGHLRDRARPGETVVGRDRELAALAALLAPGRDRASVLVTGEEAVGKTAVVLAWAERHPNRVAYYTSTAQLVAGASGLGEWQARAAAVLDAVELLDGVLYIEDLDALFGEKPEHGGVDLVAVLRRYVTAGRIRLVGELGTAALDRAERREPGLVAAMTRVPVAPFLPAAALDALRARVAGWARAEPRAPSMTEAALPVVVELTRRYQPYRAFPGKAVRLVEELRATRDVRHAPSGVPLPLDREDVYEAFSLITGVPAFLLRDDRALEVDTVVARLRRRMIGQDEAVRRVAETICVVKAQLAPADKPLATFLFVGPTGVGKTELARSLADFLFGAPDRLVRFDMSEYADPWAATRLILGDGGGDGLLTSRVREQPFCVVLLDEIEKAHPAVFDLLLQVTGEGRLTDGRGRTTYFHNAILILTSNLGARGPRAALGLGPADPDRDRNAELGRYRAAVHSAFRPELIGRLDQVIAFHRLTREEVADVAAIAIARLADRRGLGQAGIALDVSSQALAILAAGGHDSQWGARALRRHVDDRVVAPASRLIAQAGAAAKGGLVAVRAPGEDVALPIGARLGAIPPAPEAGVEVSLYRRGDTSSRRVIQGAMGVGQLRREADRAMSTERAKAVWDQIVWLRGQLALADETRPRRAKKGGAAAKGPLSSVERQLMQSELHRIDLAWKNADGTRTELRAAEDLALAALTGAGAIDDVVAMALPMIHLFRRRQYWLYTALAPRRDGVTLAAHGVDSPHGLERWATMVVTSAVARGYAVHCHLRQQGKSPTWPEGRPWKAPYAGRAILDEVTGRGQVRSILIRIGGKGAGLLYGREEGVHRFAGLGSVDPCHVIVNRVAARADLADIEWQTAAVAAPWPTSIPKGAVQRDHPAKADEVTVRGELLDVPWAEHGERLEEIALADLLACFAEDPSVELASLFAGELDKLEPPDDSGDGE
jgi:ATP-dependent Clp protease ATP-binding subunit ClpC